MKNLPEVWNPFTRSIYDSLREISSLQRQMDQLLDEYSSPYWKQSTREDYLTGPSCDFEESDTNYALSFDLPGMTKDQIKVEMKDDELIVSGERKEEHEEKKGKRYKHERYHGSFQRVFSLPNAETADKIIANYRDGVLKIEVPKLKSAITKTTQVKIGDGSSKSLVGRAA